MCLKRTLLWSTSWKIQCLDLGPIQKTCHKSLVTTAIKYVDGNGKRKYKGSKHLKKTQSLGLSLFLQSLPFSTSTSQRLRVGVLVHFTSPRLYPPRFVGKIFEKRDEFLRTKPVITKAMGWAQVYCILFHDNSMDCESTCEKFAS